MVEYLFSSSLGFQLANLETSSIRRAGAEDAAARFVAYGTNALFARRMICATNASSLESTIITRCCKSTPQNKDQVKFLS